MVIDGKAAGPLLEQFKVAQEIERATIMALHDALKGGMKNNKILLDLTDRMTEANNNKMDIWDQLLQHQL